MITVTLGQLLDMRQAIGWAGGLPLPAVDAYVMARKLATVQAHTQPATRIMDLLVQKHGEIHEATGVFGLHPQCKNWTIAQSEIDALRAKEVQLDMELIKASVLSKAKREARPSDGEAFKKKDFVRAELPPGLIAALMPLLEWDIGDDAKEG
jgi:hypothetical protein